jgi:hypothetical protein
VTSSILTLERRDWAEVASPERVSSAATGLEEGAVLFFPGLRFEVGAEESGLFSPSISTAKNVSFDPVSGRLGGTALGERQAATLRELMRRFSDSAASLLRALAPRYAGALQLGRTSFRPAEIAGRVTSWRHDDTRLHVDSFPATPVHGKRILRVFTNVNPGGRPRSWSVGEPFAEVARRFAGDLRIPLPGTAAILRLFRLTKSRRSPYDALMLQLHDRMKADAAYQAGAPQTRIDFPAGSTWTAFTDQVSHAALAGQYQLEQTFLLPVEAMLDPERSPLRVLERLKGRRLIA